MSPTFKIVGAAAVITVAALTVTKILRSQQAEWENRIAAVTALTERLREEGADARARADSLVGTAAEAAARADAGTVTIGRLRQELLDTPVPAGCEVVATDRDEIIRFQEVRYEELSNAHKLQLLAYSQLRIAETMAVERGDSLRAVLDDRPIPRPGWLPEMTVGPFVGFCVEGKPCAGVGIQLSWTVEIF